VGAEGIRLTDRAHPRGEIAPASAGVVLAGRMGPRCLHEWLGQSAELSGRFLLIKKVRPPQPLTETGRVGYNISMPKPVTAADRLRNRLRFTSRVVCVPRSLLHYQTNF
jgi:hypothetical protein